MKAGEKLYDCSGEKSLTERQCQNWFSRFRSRDFHLKDAPRSERPTEVDDGEIKAMIENTRRSTTREIAEKLNISHKCVAKRPELATRKGVIFYQDNAKPHTSLVTRKKLLELGWEVMPNPPYSPDVCQSIIIYSVHLKTI